jgi:pSer/pThr/pTyr-binding forkhead associated (FHA) protein
MPKCGRCGNATDGGAFCPFCGNRVGNGAEPPEADVLGALVNRLVKDRVAEAEAVRAVASARSAPIVLRPEQGFRVVVVRRDGSDGTSYSMSAAQFDIGRTEGEMVFDDPHLAPRHARVTSGPEGRTIQPLDAVNGVYLRMRGPVDLESGDRIIIGKQLLEFERVQPAQAQLPPLVEHGVSLFASPASAPWGCLRQLTPTAVTRDLFHVRRSEIVVGRETGDIVFSDDEFMSRRHARITLVDRRVRLEDLGSSNGTYLRLRGPHTIVAGDLVRMGDELLRFEA